MESPLQDSDLPVVPTQQLPFELVLLILETLAQQSPRKAAELVLVSRSVQACIDPILYEIVTLPNRKAASLLSRTCTTNSKPPSFFLQHVKWLCFLHDCPAPYLENILSVCQNISSLAIYAADPYSNTPDFKKLQKLQRLSVQYLPSMLQTASQHCPGLTHLDIYDISPLQHRDVPLLPSSMSLTHLSLDVSDNLSNEVLADVSAILTDSLKVCILKTHILFIPEDTLSCYSGKCEHDVRIVFACYEEPRAEYADIMKIEHLIVRRNTDFASDWGRLPSGEKDIWEMAEEVVERRREKLRKSKGK